MVKTLGFSTASLDITEEGSIILSAYNPEEGSVRVQLSAEELMIFLVSITNKLHEAKLVELELIAKKNLERERRKADE